MPPSATCWFHGPRSHSRRPLSRSITLSKSYDYGIFCFSCFMKTFRPSHCYRHADTTSPKNPLGQLVHHFDERYELGRERRKTWYASPEDMVCSHIWTSSTVATYREGPQTAQACHGTFEAGYHIPGCFGHESWNSAACMSS
jgi:hypothetical protein